jgi:hypothetical protein
MIVFVLQDYNRVSSFVRGTQIAQYLENVVVCSINDFERKLPKQKSLVIIIKQFDLGLAKKIRSRGHVVAYDVVDAPTYNFGDDAIPEFKAYDIIITPTTNYALKVSQTNNGQLAVAIPHHTINFERHVNEFKTEQLTLGYVGMFNENSHVEKIKALAADKKVRFLVGNPNTRKACIDLFKQIDVSFSYTDAPRGRLLKPNEKLSNGQSFGIPMVCSPHSSYLEYGGEPGETWISADTGVQLVDSIDELLTNHDLRARIRENGLAVGEKLHIKNVAALYDDLRKKVL